MIVLVNMMLNGEHHLDFGKVVHALILQILMVGYTSILDIGQTEDLQMMKYKLLDGKIIVRGFKGKLVKMIKDFNWR